jgi:hypothetical protein
LSAKIFHDELGILGAKPLPLPRSLRRWRLGLPTHDPLIGLSHPRVQMELGGAARLQQPKGAKKE